MCYFVTISLAEDAVDAARRRHAGPGLCIERTANPSAISTAGRGFVPLLVTAGGCSCGWYTRPRSAGLESKRDAAAAKYRRLGWSESKVNRALASMRRVAEEGDGLHGAIVNLLRSLAAEHGLVSVWVHDFRGKVETEPYTITRRERWPTEELLTRARELDTDVLVTVPADE